MAKKSPTRSRRAARGLPRRSIIALLLFGFLIVATGVIWRRSYGLAQSRELAALERKRTSLTAERIQVEGRIRTAQSRAQLLPLVERRLGMHVPPESLVVILPRPTPPASSSTSAPHDSQ